jgi:RimJ/RimL family protein N-acetyltransferase
LFLAICGILHGLILLAVNTNASEGDNQSVAQFSSSEQMTQPVEPSPVSGIHLRPVTEKDLPILFEYQREPEANEMAAFPARDRDAFMSHWKKILSDAAVTAMTVVVDGCVAGNVGCWTQDGQRLVGYWIGKEYWGRGVATQMLSQFLRLVADRPLHAHVAKHNVASIRVLEKCGFEFCTAATGALGVPADGIEELVYVKQSLSANTENSVVRRVATRTF